PLTVSRKSCSTFFLMSASRTSAVFASFSAGRDLRAPPQCSAASTLRNAITAATNSSDFSIGGTCPHLSKVISFAPEISARVRARAFHLRDQKLRGGARSGADGRPGGETRRCFSWPQDEARRARPGACSFRKQNRTGRAKAREDAADRRSDSPLGNGGKRFRALRMAVSEMSNPVEIGRAHV